MRPPLLVLVLVTGAALCRPVTATILVIEQHADAAEYQIEDSPSHFGPYVSMTGIGGYLILSEPEDGCGPVAPPPATTFRHRWILLLSDANCDSGDKVLSAQQAGYAAAVVFNTTGDGYTPMESDAEVKIPSFYIGLSNGIMLWTNFLYGSGYSIYISGYFPYTFLAFIIPAMLLIVLCLLVLISILLYRCITEYRRTARRLLPKRMLSQIPTRRYAPPAAGAAADSGGQETCAICLEDYVSGDHLRVLPCKHAFHCHCVDPWLLRSRRVCPVCKRRLVSATLAVLVSESEDEQLLPVYRSQRPPPARRSYGATLTAHSLPAAAATATGTGDGAGTGGRTRSARRQRRARRRPEIERAQSAASGSFSPVPEAEAALRRTAATAAAAPANTADTVRLLDDPAPMAVSHDRGTEEATVAPHGGAIPKLRPGQPVRSQMEPTEHSAAAGGPEIQPQGSGVASPELERPEAPPPPASGADLV